MQSRINQKKQYSSIENSWALVKPTLQTRDTEQFKYRKAEDAIHNTIQEADNREK